MRAYMKNVWRMALICFLKNAFMPLKAHDYRSGFKPKGKLDKALIATDSLASMIERMGEKPEKLNVEKLRAELENISVTNPWYKCNVKKCEEIGLEINDFLRLCLNSIEKERCG
jgi:predicted hydrolase (HD superfamily)